jgi:hypothetical protein
MMIYLPKKSCSNSLVQIFGGSATAFPHLKFQLKMAYSWGKWQGRHLSGA